MQYYKTKVELLTNRGTKSYSLRMTFPKHIAEMVGLDKANLVGFNNGPVLRLVPIFDTKDSKKYMCVRKINRTQNTVNVVIPKSYYDRLGLNELNRDIYIVYHDNKLLLVKCNGVCCICGSSANTNFKCAIICEDCIKKIKEL